MKLLLSLCGKQNLCSVMRKIILVTVFISIPFCMIGGYRDKVTIVPEVVSPYDDILTAIAEVESGFADAYNSAEKAVGLLQVRQICLADVNRRYNTRYTLDDMRNPVKAAHVFILYTAMYKADSYEEMARIWNGGPRGMQKQSTIKYWNKVKTHLK